MPAATDVLAEARALREEANQLRATRERIERDATTVATRATNAAGDAVVHPGERITVRDPGEVPIEKGWGFQSYAEFLREVMVCPNQNTPSERIRKAWSDLDKLPETVKKAATGMGELVGSDGGFLVPPGFSSKIFERMYREDPLLSRCTKETVAGNSMTYPRNAETSRATGSRWGGVRAYWVQEGSTITASAPTFGQLRLQLNKAACLARVTNELIKDTANPIESYLTRVFSSELGFAIGNAIFRGTGAGQPLGILNAPCTVSVAKETGQAAATIMTENIVKMWARRFAMGPTGSYVWLINQDCGPQIWTMTLGIGTAGIATFLPPGEGLTKKPNASLMGAPVVEIEYASTVGTVGDIVLADLEQIAAIVQGNESMSSLHVYFTTDEQAFRTSTRVDAAPWQASALTPFQGSNTQSPLITLATRS